MVQQIHLIFKKDFYFNHFGVRTIDLSGGGKYLNKRAKALETADHPSGAVLNSPQQSP
jgi:hypothetical protein